METSNPGEPLKSYGTWYAFATGECGLKLTPSYCRERIDELLDAGRPSTKSFLESYGAEYRDRVVSWFERAAEGPTH